MDKKGGTAMALPFKLYLTMKESGIVSYFCG